VVRNCFLGTGFSNDASLFEFPARMFLPDGDLTAVEQNIDKIIYGLTQWVPTESGRSASKGK
jgi:hypothetical protein